MANVIDAILGIRPKAFCSVGVRITSNIDFLGVRDSVVLVSHSGEGIVDPEFIGENHRALLNIVSDQWENSLAFDVSVILHFAKNGNKRESQRPSHTGGMQGFGECSKCHGS